MAKSFRADLPLDAVANEMNSITVFLMSQHINLNETERMLKHGTQMIAMAALFKNYLSKFPVEEIVKINEAVSDVLKLVRGFQYKEE